jgi:hypothetical protein
MNAFVVVCLVDVKLLLCGLYSIIYIDQVETFPWSATVILNLVVKMLQEQGDN